MKRRVRVAQYGIGKMGSILLRYAMDKGGELVAAFARSPAQIGRDAGDVAGIGPVGVVVSDCADADRVLGETRPDICLISTKGTMPELREAFSACARNGVNAITIGEEAFWPWTTSPEITRELDALAKANGCTLSASGYPDVFWGALVTTLAGSSERIAAIKGYVNYNIENYGLDFVTGHGVGMTLAEFERAHAGEDLGRPCLPGDQNGWLCAVLGLAVTGQTLRHVARVSERDVLCRSLGKTIPAGDVIGMSLVARTETAEGITIEIEVCGKLYEPGECDVTTWTLSGEPDSELIINKPVTPALTCSTPVNRIPQVINAPPGYVTADRLPPVRYLVRPLNAYVEKDD